MQLTIPCNKLSREGLIGARQSLLNMALDVWENSSQEVVSNIATFPR